MPQNNNNNYKPNNNRRYNNKPNYRRYNNKPNNGPQKKKGILSFLFSVEGKISKELFTSLYLIIILVLSIFSAAFTTDPITKKIGTLPSIAYFFVAWFAVAFSYKRAHSLGISGIYSFMGTYLFTPFFTFYKPERDFANDGMYKNKFTTLKKIGAFFQRTMFTKILYILILGFLYVVNYIGVQSEDVKDLMNIMLIVTAFNLLQVLTVRKSFKLYTNIVKVLSFLSLMAFVIFISVAATIIFIAQMQVAAQMQMGAGMPM